MVKKIIYVILREELGLVEHLVANQKVGGSNPPSRSKGGEYEPERRAGRHAHPQG